MGARRVGYDATLWGAVNKSDPQQIWLKYIFKCVSGLTQQRRHGRHANRPTIELLDHDGEQLAIRCIKARMVDLQTLQCLRRSLTSDVR